MANGGGPKTRFDRKKLANPIVSNEVESPHTVITERKIFMIFKGFFGKISGFFEYNHKKELDSA